MDAVVQMIWLFGMPILKEGRLKKYLGVARYASNMCPWVFYLDCTINDDRIITYPGNTFTGTGQGYVSDQLHLHSSGNPFVQTSSLLQQFDSPGGHQRINFLTNLNDHFINSRFSHFCLIGTWLLAAQIATLFWITNSNKQHMEFLRWISCSSMAGTESSNVLMDVLLFHEMILYLLLYFQCNWLLLKWTCVFGSRR